MSKNTITLELTDKQSMAMAQYCKRSGYTDYLLRAKNEQEAELIENVMTQIRCQLNLAGFDPR